MNLNVASLQPGSVVSRNQELGLQIVIEAVKVRSEATCVSV